MILNDVHITNTVSMEKMIIPFIDDLIRGSKISYGLSSFGYDVRLSSNVVLVKKEPKDFVIDPKKMNGDDITSPLQVFMNGDGDEYVLLPPKSYALGHTVETFNIPRDISVIALGKSTYARAGLVINTTPIEAGFKGQVVIEMFNATDNMMQVYVNEGISQFIFLEGEACSNSYADRNGKYQGQSGITLGKV